MKGRAAPKALNDDARTRTKAPANAKKLTKKKNAKSAASCILGLKKSQVDAPTDGSTRWSSEEGNSVDHVAECQRLRQQLERVLIDHQRQEEEIVALRALAKSLKEEVEMIQERQQLQSSSCSGDKASAGRHQRVGSHEFFKLDVQIEKLEGENAELRRQLEDSHDELQRARAYIADKLPVYKLAAVKANAELRCVKSQLQQERKQTDRLQRQLVKCRARQDDVLARVGPERGNNQEEHEDDGNIKESETVRREREAFFRQCMRQQDGCHSPGNKSGTQSDVDDIIETRRTQFTGSKSMVKTDEDLLDLDFDLDETTSVHHRRAQCPFSDKEAVLLG